MIAWERDLNVIWIFLTVQSSSLSPAVAFTAYLRSQYSVFISPHPHLCLSVKSKVTLISQIIIILSPAVSCRSRPLPWWPWWYFRIMNKSHLPSFLPTGCDRRVDQDCKFNSTPASPAWPAWLGQSRTNSAAKMLVQTKKSPGGSEHFFTWASPLKN